MLPWPYLGHAPTRQVQFNSVWMGSAQSLQRFSSIQLPILQASEKTDSIQLITQNIGTSGNRFDPFDEFSETHTILNLFMIQLLSQPICAFKIWRLNLLKRQLQNLRSLHFHSFHHFIPGGITALWLPQWTSLFSHGSSALNRIMRQFDSDSSVFLRNRYD